MKNKESIDALIQDVDETIQKIKNKHNTNKVNEIFDIKDVIDLKRILENLRTCLDYLAVDIHKKTLNSGKKVYFPIANSINDFQNQIKNYFGDLETQDYEVYNLLLSLQTFHNGSNWLTDFSKLVNIIKHNNFFKTHKEVTISDNDRIISYVGNVKFEKGSVTIPNEASITIGNGASLVISHEDVQVLDTKIDFNTQLPEDNSKLDVDIKTFIKDNNIELIPFIDKSIHNIYTLCDNLYKYFK